MSVLLELLALEYVRLSIGSFISGGVIAFLYRVSQTQDQKEELVLFLLLSIPILGLLSNVQLYIILMYLLGIVIVYGGIIYFFSERKLIEEFETETSSLRNKYEWR